MKLIKLAYIAHGWHLAIYGKPLLREDVKAWKYGPVVDSLYHAFKSFKNNPIPVDELKDFPENKLPPQTKALIDAVWNKYSKLSAYHLSTLTHMDGTPWQKTFNGEPGVSIPNDLIQQYYAAKRSKTETGSGH